VNRADLRALTTDVLATLANRGLVKRAAREVDAGDGPAVREDPDGTVRGTFGDGVEVAFPVGATLDTASCSCPAAGVCRHRIGLVLAYQATAATEQADPQEPAAGGWSPGSFDDEELARALGTRTVTAARRRLAAGYSALLDRGADGPPCAELAACVVRFLVPGELGYAHTGAEGPDHGQAVALAVWAFRAADERGLREGQVRLDVGGGPKPRAERTGMEPAVELATELLFEGATHAGPVLGAALRRMHRTVERQGLHWPAGALYDLSDQLDAVCRSGHRAARPAARHRGRGPSLPAAGHRRAGRHIAAAGQARRPRLPGRRPAGPAGRGIVLRSRGRRHRVRHAPSLERGPAERSNRSRPGQSPDRWSVARRAGNGQPGVGVGLTQRKPGGERNIGTSRPDYRHAGWHRVGTAPAPGHGP
jgi:hypothetical protein